MNAEASSRTYGHLAVHYRNPGEGALAARLLREIGFTECYAMTQPDGNTFYHFVIDEKADRGIDRIFYLLCMPDVLRRLYEEIHAALKVGTAAQHPAVTALRAAQAHDPEFNFHVAVVFPSLEDLEEKVLHLQRLAAEDPELKGRIKITLNRARPGTPEVDARMDASPVFAGVDRYTYGPNGVQVFVETDLIAGGPLGDNWVFEFDHVFPGYRHNILNAPSDDAIAILDAREGARVE
ncbi:MAG: hypothetical protein N2423_05845 [Novosphingobium sp.]|nr:hypothetical protein [Novosphingobium sp.]